jgi:hypothetical protein
MELTCQQNWRIFTQQIVIQKFPKAMEAVRGDACFIQNKC